jgi:hypothetical protein
VSDCFDTQQSIHSANLKLNVLPGFQLHLDVVTESEESALIDACDGYNLVHVAMRGRRLLRRLRCFGKEFGPNFHSLREAAPIPNELYSLRRRTSELVGYDSRALTQAIVQAYPVGSSVGWHLDAPQLGPVVIGVSLAGEALLRFRSLDAGREGVSVSLPPRSAYVLRDEARSRWLHSLSPARQFRLSITFRAPEAEQRVGEDVCRTSTASEKEAASS